MNLLHRMNKFPHFDTGLSCMDLKIEMYDLGYTVTEAEVVHFRVYFCFLCQNYQVLTHKIELGNSSMS